MAQAPRSAAVLSCRFESKDVAPDWMLPIPKRGWRSSVSLPLADMCAWHASAAQWERADLGPEPCDHAAISAIYVPAGASDLT